MNYSVEYGIATENGDNFVHSKKKMPIALKPGKKVGFNLEGGWFEAIDSNPHYRVEVRRGKNGVGVEVTMDKVGKGHDHEHQTVAVADGGELLRSHKTLNGIQKGFRVRA